MVVDINKKRPKDDRVDLWVALTFWKGLMLLRVFLMALRGSFVTFNEIKFKQNCVQSSSIICPLYWIFYAKLLRSIRCSITTINKFDNCNKTAPHTFIKMIKKSIYHLVLLGDLLCIASIGLLISKSEARGYKKVSFQRYVDTSD